MYFEVHFAPVYVYHVSIRLQYPVARTATGVKEAYHELLNDTDRSRFPMNHHHHPRDRGRHSSLACFEWANRLYSGLFANDETCRPFAEGAPRDRPLQTFLISAQGGVPYQVCMCESQHAASRTIPLGHRQNPYLLAAAGISIMHGTKVPSWPVSRPVEPPLLARHLHLI